MIVGGAQENTLLSVEGLEQNGDYDVALLTGTDEGREGELLSRARSTTKLIVVPELGRAINPFCDLIALCKGLSFDSKRQISHCSHAFLQSWRLGQDRSVGRGNSDHHSYSAQPGFSRISTLDNKSYITNREKGLCSFDPSLYQRL